LICLYLSENHSFKFLASPNQIEDSTYKKWNGYQSEPKILRWMSNRADKNR
jgi:hypothetical protein